MFITELCRLSQQKKLNVGLSQKYSRLGCTFFIGTCLWMTGCGSSEDLPEMVPVTGSVVYAGDPVSTGAVRFVPEDETKGRLAIGDIQSDGTFTMKSFNDQEGVVPGNYRVVIVSEKDDPSAGPQKEGLAAPVKKTSLIPNNYASFTTTSLKETIGEGDPEKTVKYELKD
jgi:hypothetical protein